MNWLAAGKNEFETYLHFSVNVKNGRNISYARRRRRRAIIIILYPFKCVFVRTSLHWPRWCNKMPFESVAAFAFMFSCIDGSTNRKRVRARATQTTGWLAGCVHVLQMHLHNVHCAHGRFSCFNFSVCSLSSVYGVPSYSSQTCFYHIGAVSIQIVQPFFLFFLILLFTHFK